MSGKIVHEAAISGEKPRLKLSHTTTVSAWASFHMRSGAVAANFSGACESQFLRELPSFLNQPAL